jgi:hypothetical protein
MIERQRNAFAINAARRGEGAGKRISGDESRSGPAG